MTLAVKVALYPNTTKSNSILFKMFALSYEPHHSKLAEITIILLIVDTRLYHTFYKSTYCISNLIYTCQNDLNMLWWKKMTPSITKKKKTYQENFTIRFRCVISSSFHFNTKYRSVFNCFSEPPVPQPTPVLCLSIHTLSAIKMHIINDKIEQVSWKITDFHTCYIGMIRYLYQRESEMRNAH